MTQYRVRRVTQILGVTKMMMRWRNCNNCRPRSHSTTREREPAHLVNDETNYVDDYNARRVDGARRVRDARRRQSGVREEVPGDAFSRGLTRHGRS